MIEGIRLTIIIVLLKRRHLLYLDFEMEHYQLVCPDALFVIVPGPEVELYRDSGRIRGTAPWTDGKKFQPTFYGTAVPR